MLLLIKRFIFISFYWFTILVAITYGLACFTPYISPARFWVMGFLALGFPALLLVILVNAVIWFFFKKRICIALLVLIIGGQKNISVLFASNHTTPFALQKAPGSIRILSWNVKGFDTHDLARDSARSLRHKILEYIALQDADILCIQDFTEYSNYQLPSNIIYLQDSLHYPYHYFADDYKEYPPWGPAYAGIAVFSKYPISQVQHIKYPGKITPESFIIADINIHNIKRRFIVTHLQSMHLRQLTPQNKNAWDNNEDSAIIYTGNAFKKLQFFQAYHALQSQLVKKYIAQSPLPIIFSADLNEVPTSYVYNQIRGNLKDVFLMKGFGLGRTYVGISPTLRIDHLMVTPSIEVVQYKKEDVFLSDHFPQVMDVKW